MRTDHFSLRFLLDQRLTTVPQHHWVSKLLGYDFAVKYKSGATNVVADALSRRDVLMMAALELSGPQFSLFADLRLESMRSPSLLALSDAILEGSKPPQWTVKDGLIPFNGCVFVSPDSAHRLHLLELAHGHGHEGVN